MWLVWVHFLVPDVRKCTYLQAIYMHHNLVEYCYVTAGQITGADPGGVMRADDPPSLSLKR